MKIQRTDSSNRDFQALVNDLNAYLAVVDGDEHEFYHQFNGIEKLRQVVVVYDAGKALGCGAIKPFRGGGMEIKRMFTVPESRGRGVAKLVLTELEKWAEELGENRCVLETGWRQEEAVGLYKSCGYRQIPNFEPYVHMENSVCFEKVLG